MVRAALLISALLGASPAVAQQKPSPAPSLSHYPEPQLHLGRSDFSLPVVEYRAPDGTMKISQGIVIGRDLAPNARVGVGLFRMKPRYDEISKLPTGGSSRKVAVGLSLRF